MPKLSPSQTQATTVATTGSSVATMDARVAGMCRNAPVRSENVIIVPMTTMNPTSAQTGAVCSERFPCSETESSRTPHGNSQSGCATAQRAAAKRKP